MIINKLFIPLPFLHPLLPITFAFILGICFGASSYNIVFYCFLGLSLFLFAYLTTNYYKNFGYIVASICISFFAGKHSFDIQQQNFYTWTNSLKKPVDIVATITDITPCITKNYRFIINAHIDKMYDTDYSSGRIWQKTPYYLTIYTNEFPKLLIQDQIFLSCIKISSPSNANSIRYALKYNIGGTIFCNKLHYNLISRPSWSLKRRLYTIRKKFSEQLFKKMSNNTALFYALLFLGTQYQNKEHNKVLRNTFQKWGILHYLARSGLHLVVFIMIWNMLLLIVPCAYRIREGLLLVLSSIYFIMSWPTISFVRAFATYILYKIASVYRRSSNTLHVVTLVTLFFLIVNPMYLFCLDFQLSFGLTFALCWFQNNKLSVKNIQTNP